MTNPPVGWRTINSPGVLAAGAAWLAACKTPIPARAVAGRAIAGRAIAGRAVGLQLNRERLLHWCLIGNWFCH